MSRSVSSSVVLVVKPKPLVGALAAALLMCSTSYAASFGHSRLVSALGQPLHINVPVTQLNADDLRSFSASPAPAAAWEQAGLTPPVDLDSMQVRLADGYAPGSKLIQVRSGQAFNKPVADLLLDVRTATGQQRYQVSLLTHARPDAVAPAQQGGTDAASSAPPTVIHVRRGDTMFAIAQSHAVPGVSVYQMMIALQRANPQAFIHGNLNLVKAGARLTVPDNAALTAISDREARRLFQQQAQAFAQYRQRAAGRTSAVAESGAAGGVVTASGSPLTDQPAAGVQDQLRLSGGQTAAVNTSHAVDNAAATRQGIEESRERVSQLEENVRTLNEALRAQGSAASNLVIDSAKGLSDSIAQVTGTADSPAGSADGAAANGTAANNGAAENGAAANGTAANGTAANGTAANGTAAGGAAAGDSAAGDSAAGGTAAGGTAAGGTAAGGTAADGTAPGDSAAGDSAAGGTAAGDSAAGDSAAGDSAAGDSAAGDSAAGDSAAGDSAAGDSAAGGTAAGGTAAGGTA
ncbi:MAG: FimV/HubP family polar landmark protein, partial [Pusillimonas sp.]